MSTELYLTEIAPGGDAVGRRADGLVVFVPGGAPGDRALVELAPAKKGHARARLLRVLTAGEDRVPPACPLAAPEACGGCPLMPVSRAAELNAKTEWVRRALRPSRISTAAAILPILSPTPELGYRLRAKLMVRDGKLGFAGARSHRGVAIATCPVLLPALDRVLFGCVAPLAAQLGEGATVHGISDGEAVILAVRLGRTGRFLAVRAALEKLLAAGKIAGVRLDDHETFGKETLELGCKSEWGTFSVAADGFAQPSAAGHEILPRLVVAAALGCERVLELYSGSGNLTRALRSVAKEVVCVEGDAAAAARAQQLFAADKAVRIESQPAQNALAKLVAKNEKFDAVVLDPPRTGAREALPLLSRLGAQRIVYVSCDAMTLGRDLSELVSLGYVTQSVQPVDLTPRAAHVECVAVLRRA